MSRKQIIMRVILCAIGIVFIIFPLFGRTLTDSGGRVESVHIELIAAALFAVGYIIYIYVRTSHMMRDLGVSTEKEFEDMKESCTFRHSNRFYMSDTWVINTYSLRVYLTSDIENVSTYDSYRRRGGRSYYINVRLRDGNDRFRMTFRSDRDMLADAIREYSINRKMPYGHAQNPTPSAQQPYQPYTSRRKTPDISKQEAERLFNEAMKKKYGESNKGDWL